MKSNSLVLSKLIFESLKCYSKSWKSWLDTNGRSSRKEYCLTIPWYVIHGITWYAIVYYLYIFLDNNDIAYNGTVLKVLLVLVFTMILVPAYTLSIRRLQDAGISHYWLYIIFILIPQVNLFLIIKFALALYLLYLFLQPTRK